MVGRDDRGYVVQTHEAAFLRGRIQNLQGKNWRYAKTKELQCEALPEDSFVEMDMVHNM